MKFSFAVWPKSRLSLKDVSYASSVGFVTAEVSLEYPWPYWEMPKFEELLGILKGQGLKLGAHLPWRDFALASPYEDVRRGAISYMRRLLDILRKWEFQYAVSHFSTKEKVRFNNRDYLQMATSDLKLLIKEYRDSNVEFAVENSPYGPLSQKENFLTLAKDLESKVCLDYGHIIAKIMGEGEAQLSILEEILSDWTNTFAGMIEVIHMHGVAKINGQVVEHMRISGYEKAFSRSLMTLEKLGKNPHVTLEVFFKDELFRDAEVEDVAKELELLRQARELT
jgi:sugar phosphate isomerase/epimerase